MPSFPPPSWARPPCLDGEASNHAEEKSANDCFTQLAGTALSSECLGSCGGFGNPRSSKARDLNPACRVGGWLALSGMLSALDVLEDGCSSKLNRRGYAGFGPCFHLPGFHFGTVFLTHSQNGKVQFQPKIGFVIPLTCPHRNCAHPGF